MIRLGVFITLGICVITGIHGDADISYRTGSKIVGLDVQYVFRAHYTPKTFEDAEAECVENNGHLITIKNHTTMLLVDDFLFDEDVLDGSDFDFFWIGLRWENKSWVFEDGDPNNWEGPIGYSNWDDDPMPEDGNHCVGVKFTSKLGFKWHRESCSAKKTFLCMELFPKCLPTVQAKDGSWQTMQTSKNNYGCPNHRADMTDIANNCNCNSTYEIRRTLGGLVCDDQYATENVRCLPGCPVQHANVPDDAVLLDRDQVYYEGRRVAYYCPGVFEYHGNIHPHNLIELPCRADEPYAKTVRGLLCHRYDVDHHNKEVKTIHASLNYNYKLHCGHKGLGQLPQITKYIWYHDSSLVDVTKGPTYKIYGNGDLEIRHLNEDSTGTYFCIAKYANTYLPGNNYNVSSEHHEAILAAIKKWNSYESMHLGYFLDPVNNTYYSHVAYFESKTFDKARTSCESAAPGGRLALIAGIQSQKVLNNLFTPERMKQNYQFHDRPDEYPDKFWSGLVLNLHHHYDWMDMAGKRDDMLTWRDQDVGAKHKGACAAITLHDTLSHAHTADLLSMLAIDCEERLPYVCTFPAQQCLPPSVAKPKPDELASYKCSNNTAQLGKVKTDDCECNATRVNPENHESCTKKNVWNTALCVPECQPNPEYGAIVYPEKKYYFGMYMTYFCPGHFEVNGIEYNHNSLALKCDPARQDIINLQCRREKLLSENALVKVTKLNLEIHNYTEIDLICNKTDSNLSSTVWMIKNEFNLDVWKDERLKSVNGDVKLLTGPSFANDQNTLRIRHVDESVRGVYGCYFDNYADRKGDGEPAGLGILLPGNVFKIMFEGDEEEEEVKTVTSASSLMAPWQQAGIYVHHAAMLLLLLALVL